MSAQVWRYSVPAVNGVESWGVLLLDDSCCFAAITDYGNFCYRWHPRGMPEGMGFREFLLTCSSDYLGRKLRPKEQYSAEKTVIAIRDAIVQGRRDGTFSKEQARDEWENSDHLRVENECSFDRWLGETDISDAWELHRTERDSDCVAFLERIWPRLRAQIAADARAVTEAA